MKKCSYCGHQNEDTTDACLECGTRFVSSAAPAIEPLTSHPTEASEIVRAFDTMGQAHELARRLTALGIEAWIPESAPLPFSNTRPADFVTVRVAARDRTCAEAIAAEMTAPEPASAVAGATDCSTQPLPLPGRERRINVTWREMSLFTGFVLLVPIVSGVVTHSIRDTKAMGPMFWLWALFSAACLCWGRYAFQRYRSLGWGCVAIDLLQIILFMFIFWTIDFPANTQSQPFEPRYNSNPHNW